MGQLRDRTAREEHGMLPAGHAPNYGCQAIAGGTQHAEYTEVAGSAVGLRDLDRERCVGARVLVGDLATIRPERSPDQ